MRPHGKVLLLGHTTEIVNQLEAAVRTMCSVPADQPIVEQAERQADPAAEIIVGSTQSVGIPYGGSYKRLDRLGLQGKVAAILTDEGHHATETNSSYAGPHIELGAWRPEGYPTGDVMMATLSATLKRHDGQPIMFSELVYNITLHELVDRGRIVPWEIDRVPTTVNLDAVALTRDGLDFNEEALAEAINTDERHCVIIERHLQKWSDMQFIGFMPGVAAAERMAELCREVFNLAVYAITGQTPPETRKLMVEMLKSGYLHGLINCKALTEGTDLPPAAVAWMAHPTRSAPFYKQMAGRVLRTWDKDRWNAEYPELYWSGDDMGLQPRKRFAVLLDAIDICTRFTLATGASLDAPEEPTEKEKGAKVDLGGAPKTSLRERREELKEGEWVEVDEALHKYLAPDGRVATIYRDDGGWWANLDEFGIRSGWWKKLLPAFSYANLMLGAATSGSRQAERQARHGQ